MQVVASIGIVMLGSLLAAELLRRGLSRPFSALGRKLHMDDCSFAALLLRFGFVSATRPSVADQREWICGQSYECRFSCLRRFPRWLASRLYRGRRAEPDLSAAYHQADRRSYGCGFGASADKAIRREFPGFVNTASPNYPTYRHKNAARFEEPRRILLLFLN